MTDTMPFGRFRGVRTLENRIRETPEQVVWLMSRFPWFQISVDAKALLTEILIEKEARTEKASAWESTSAWI